MTQLANISGKQAIRSFCKIGYEIVRQKGSHARLRHPESLSHRSLTVPLHRELKIGLLHQLIKDAGLTAEEFLSNL
ncbi:MAG: type II toxin-antitoxin system HicA family toxin [Candidatus Magasanikbacteria bacterium]|nr:type II toxin-antitoxin system HicA family toxin [Candidatus Magasanikbacteria bacterium]